MRGRPVLDLDIKKIWDDYQSGLSCYKIEKKYGLSKNIVRRKLVQAGYKLRTHEQALATSRVKGTRQGFGRYPVDDQDWVRDDSRVGVAWRLGSVQCGKTDHPRALVDKLAGDGYGWVVFSGAVHKPLKLPDIIGYGARSTHEQACAEAVKFLARKGEINLG